MSLQGAASNSKTREKNLQGGVSPARCRRSKYVRSVGTWWKKKWRRRRRSVKQRWQKRTPSSVVKQITQYFTERRGKLPAASSATLSHSLTHLGCKIASSSLTFHFHPFSNTVVEQGHHSLFAAAFGALRARNRDSIQNICKYVLTLLSRYDSKAKGP